MPLFDRLVEIDRKGGGRERGMTCRKGLPDAGREPGTPASAYTWGGCLNHCATHRCMTVCIIFDTWLFETSIS